MTAHAPVILVGFRHSVFQRVVRIVLHQKAVPHRVEEVDPLAVGTDEALRGIHPFGCIPVLRRGGFDLYETAAITRYVDGAFEGPALVPDDPRAAARMTQVIAIWDAYGYRPIIRQVFARRVFAPWEGSAANEAEIIQGIAAARPVLAALEAIAIEGRVLDGRTITLADCHSAAMMDYFVRAPEGAGALAAYPSLTAWWVGGAQVALGRRARGRRLTDEIPFGRARVQPPSERSCRSLNELEWLVRSASRPRRSCSVDQRYVRR